jgi:MYXO-CTERM domain-containing protein
LKATIVGLGVALAAAAPAHAETRFEANAGQWSPRVRFVARQGHATWFVTDRGATVALHARDRQASVTLALAGAVPATVRGEAELAAKSNFFVGDRSHWRTGVPNYARVRTQNQVPGVDVVWHAGTAGLEYDLEVAAGTDARTLSFEVSGARGMDIAHDGSLQIATAAGQLVEQPPRVIQNGHELAARYRIDRGRVRFALDGYDPSAPVVIDPVVKYSTYLGGNGSIEEASAIAIDAGGNAYITGTTDSLNFPNTSSRGYRQATEAFVTKLAPDGATIVYSTYYSGSIDESGTAIAVDAAGHAFITGNTTSSDLPVTTGAYQTTMRGAGDTFVVELGPDGDALVYATYLGGNNNDDYATGIAIDSAGNAYVTGYTQSATWPTTAGALSTTKCGATGSSCTYVVKLAAGGGALVYSTFLGSADTSVGKGIAVDAAGNAYVTGNVVVTVAGGGRFPTTTGAFQTTAPLGTHPYIAKIDPAGSTLVYASYLHGAANANESAGGVAVDSTGNAYVTGWSNSTTFPTTAGAYQPTLAGNNDVFVTKLDATGAALAYSTFIGGTASDVAHAIAITPAGQAFVAGETTSMDFPTTPDAPQGAFGGGTYDAFVATLDPTGHTLGYGTYLGGVNFDQAYGLAASSVDAVYVVGKTNGGYPTKQGAFQMVYGGGSYDGFVTKLVPGTNGSSCLGVLDCISGFCVDGVCCDTACSDQCAACDVEGNVGTCMPATGAPHGSREACALSACACDGTNTDKCTNNGAECTIGVCADDHTLHNPDGSTTDCTPYRCSASGACATACANVDDCIAPNICDPNGKCIPLPEQEAPGGCGCRAAGNGWSVWWIGILGFIVLRRRRRS